MTTSTRTYRKDTSDTSSMGTRERTGGPRGGSDTPSELVEYLTSRTPFGSHMPLDTMLHWDWLNPLNIIPGFMLVLLVFAVIGLFAR